MKTCEFESLNFESWVICTWRVVKITFWVCISSLLRIGFVKGLAFYFERLAFCIEKSDESEMGTWLKMIWEYGFYVFTS